jgi:hypothetical protein
MRRLSLSPLTFGHVVALKKDPAGRRLDDPVYHLHRRGLAAPGRSDEDDDLALRYLQREVVYRWRLLTRKNLRQILQPDHDLRRVRHTGVSGTVIYHANLAR